jgi:peptidyl-prolyl cis-trans isomerase A (cyclophilin A)
MKRSNHPISAFSAFPAFSAFSTLAALGVMATLTACEKSPPPPAQASVAAAPAAPAAAVSLPPGPGLLKPDAAKVDAAGPDSFAVHVVTSKGPFDLKIHRNWAPKGSDRLYYLISNNYYDGIRFYRVLSGFMAQFGAAGDTAVGRVWSERRITDDPVTHSNTRGTLTFATAGPDTRTTQLFINYGSNAMLDGQHFAPLGEVTSGMPVVDSLYNGYGEGAPQGHGPDQGQLGHEGNAYLIREFPKLDYIVTARVTEEWKKK